MYTGISLKIEKLVTQFDLIPASRELALRQLATHILSHRSPSNSLQLLFVCTHNSRRSHMGQFWAELAASYYGIHHVESFSAGTEVTNLNKNVLFLLKDYGCQIESSGNGTNPTYQIRFSESHASTYFSKLIAHEDNPKSGFYALMMCSEADANCPFVPGAIHRAALPFDDPKEADGTEFTSEAYLTTFNEIGIQLLFLFKLLNE